MSTHLLNHHLVFWVDVQGTRVLDDGRLDEAPADGVAHVDVLVVDVVQIGAGLSVEQVLAHGVREADL